MGPHTIFPPSASATPPSIRKRPRSTLYDESLAHSRARRVLPNRTVLEMIPEEPEEEVAEDENKNKVEGEDEDDDDACRPRKKARIHLDDPLDARRNANGGTRDRRRVSFSRKPLVSCPSSSTATTRNRYKQRYAPSSKSLDALPSTPASPALPPTPPSRTDPVPNSSTPPASAPAPSDPLVTPTAPSVAPISTPEAPSPLQTPFDPIQSKHLSHPIHS